MTLYEATQLSTLLGSTDVTDIVGDRIYPSALPSNPTLPAVTYTLISSPRDVTQTGSGLTRPRYRWDCWAETYDTAVALAIVVIQALGAGRWVADEADHREPLTGLFRRRVDILGWINSPEAP